MLRYKSLLFIFITFLFLNSCGGGGSVVPDTAPTISNLIFSPHTVNQFDGGGAITVRSTTKFIDPNGDIHSSVIKRLDTGEKVEIIITGFNGKKSGTVFGEVIADTTVKGDFHFEIYYKDKKGNKSNTLSGLFRVI